LRRSSETCQSKLQDLLQSDKDVPARRIEYTNDRSLHFDCRVSKEALSNQHEVDQICCLLQATHLLHEVVIIVCLKLLRQPVPRPNYALAHVLSSSKSPDNPRNHGESCTTLGGLPSGVTSRTTELLGVAVSCMLPDIPKAILQDFTHAISSITMQIS
jgi:hypothetical protein